MNTISVDTVLDSHEGQSWSWPALSLLTMFWGMCALIVILSGFYQKEFFNPELVIPFLGVIALCEFLYSMFLLVFDRWQKKQILWWSLFTINSGLITFTLISVHWNQSMFFLMYLINIVATGLTLKSRGSYLIGLLSLIGFDFAVLVSPQTKLVGSLFSLAVNNGSLIVVAFLSGQLSDYLENLGLRLNVATRDFRNMKNLHQLILGQIPSGIITVDDRGELVQGNERAKQILSKDVFERSERWGDFKKELLRNHRNALGQTEFSWNGGSGSEPKKIIRCQKAKVQIEDVEQPVGADIYVLEDVTELRALEEILRNQEKLAAIGKLAAGIAHEIRNPLASISGSVQMLSVQAGTEDDKKLFNIVIRETDRLNLLISEFLDYAKPLPQPTDRMSLGALLREVLELVTYNKKLRPDVRQDRHWDGEYFVLGYKDKLKQAFLNIIINAYQAMDKAETATLRVEMERGREGEQGLIVLRIRDSGSGMKEETRRRIFEPFYTTKSQGTGLGLAVTHKIFDGHGASIIVESEEGKGTEFVIKMKDADRLI
jgi:two-component system sensor histidine kinase PilS (NtrC family)